VSVQKVFLCPFHCKPRQLRVIVESPGLENILQVLGNRPEVGQNHDARKAVSATLSVFKWSGAILHPRSSKVSVYKVLFRPFHCTPGPSRFSLESPGLENIPQVPAKGAEVGQNHNARKAVMASLAVLKWSGAIFRPRRFKVSVQIVWLCPSHYKSRPSGVSFKTPGLENIRQVPANRAEVGENHDARKAVSATLSVLKWSGAIFRLRSSKVSVQKVLLYSFHCKPRPSGVSLESPGLENVTRFQRKPAKVAQNDDARRTVSATLSVLKWSGAIFRPRSWKRSVRSFYLSPFQTEGIRGYFRVPGPGKYPPCSWKSSQSCSKSRCLQDRLAYSLSLNVKWGYISAKKLESERSKTFAVSISLQSRAFRS